MKKKEKDEHFAAHLPGILHYHQTMLSDGVRNRMLYEAIKESVTGETDFLDIGAGTGVWAILAAKLGARRVVAVEIEEALIPVIHRHAQENGVANKIEIIHGNSDDVKIRGKFNVIVSELFGSDAMGEATVTSFVKLRNRFLAPGGVLIPQKLAMFAAPVRVEKSVRQIPAGLPIECDFLKSLKINYALSLSFAERDGVRFVAAPKRLFEIDFRTVASAATLESLSASWNLNDLSEPNAFVIFNQSTFSDELVLDTFRSQSWGASFYEFEPFSAPESGEIKFDLTMKAQNTAWTVSFPSNQESQPQSYSPVFAFTRLRMAQKTTPHRRFKPPKEKPAAKTVADEKSKSATARK